MLGMANKRDGGVIIIGVQEQDGRLEATGLSNGDLETWTQDSLASFAAPYADPSIEFELGKVEHNGKHLVSITIREFRDIPIVCIRDYPDVLRQGACYVRSFRKAETTEVPTQTEMRDLLELASEKKLREFLQKAYRVGLIASASALPSDGSLYEQQMGPFK